MKQNRKLTSVSNPLEPEVLEVPRALKNEKGQRSETELFSLQGKYQAACSAFTQPSSLMCWRCCGTVALAWCDRDQMWRWPTGHQGCGR